MTTINTPAPSHNSSDLRDEVIRYLVDFATTLQELELRNESEAVRKKIEEFNQGLFHVLFTGTFSSGKTTLLNGLQREDLLRASIVPETAVITKIVNGENDDNVVVSFRDPDKPDRQMRLEDFKEEFHLNDKHSTKFHEVSYVTIKRRLSNDTVIFVDSPGINNTAEDDAVAFDFADNKADAVVFVMNATSLGKDGEREYIQKRFAGRNLRNVFFVVNWYNEVQPADEKYLDQRLQNMLRSTFSDANGNFDEELYNKRVFRIDALTSFYARTGVARETRRGTQNLKEAVPPEEDQYTGVPEFEAALREFLESSDKDKEAYRNYLRPLSVDYKAVDDTIQFLAKAMQLSQGELKKKIQDMEKTVAQLKDIVEHIQDAIDVARKAILTNFSRNYDALLRDLDNNWQNDMANVQVPFGIKNAAKLITMKVKSWWQNIGDPEAAEEALASDPEFLQNVAPIKDMIQRYIQGKLVDMEKGILADSQSTFETLANKIKLYSEKIANLKSTNVELNNIFDQIKEMARFDPSGMTKSFNIGHVLVSLLFGNPDQALTNIIQGKGGLGPFLSDILFRELMELLIIIVVNTLFDGFAIIYYIIRVLWGIISGQQAVADLGQKVVQQSGPAIHTSLMENKEVILNQISLTVNKTLKESTDEALSAFEKALDQNLGMLKELDEEYAANAGKNQSILQQKRALQEKLLASFNDLSSLVGGKTFNSQGLLDYATPGAHTVANK